MARSSPPSSTSHRFTVTEQQPNPLHSDIPLFADESKTILNSKFPPFNSESPKKRGPGSASK